MATFTAVFFTEESLTLPQLTDALRQTEQSFGPLLAISSCEDFAPDKLTCFTHSEAAAPAAPLELRLCTGGVIPTTPKTLVCIGNCFVDTQLRMVAAFR